MNTSQTHKIKGKNKRTQASVVTKEKRIQMIKAAVSILDKRSRYTIFYDTDQRQRMSINIIQKPYRKLIQRGHLASDKFKYDNQGYFSAGTRSGKCLRLYWSSNKFIKFPHTQFSENFKYLYNDYGEL